jgi:uncharacterized lipoprotein YmbA
MAAVLVVAAVGGCGSSPPVTYHALSQPSAPTSSGQARLLVEMLPVAVPERLNRENMVLTDAAGRLDVRDIDRWAALPADEIRQIVADTLWQRLGAVDVYQAPVAPSASGLPQYRLALRIERFEAKLGAAATVEASWTARRLPQGHASTCRVSVALPLSDGTAAGAAAALAAATGQMARAVTDSLGRLDQGAADACATEAP